MRVLLINFEMDTDSPVVPWQARVATALADRCENVLVLTEKIGRYEARPNMQVALIPRRPWGIPKRLGGGWFVNFQLLRLLYQHKCDVCFIHMAHLWAYRLWPTFMLMRLPVLLWYAHGSVTTSLKAALHSVERVITSTPEGFRIESPKVQVIGQAIDTSIFKLPYKTSRLPELVYVGRISERKRVLLMLDVLAELRKLDPSTPWHLKLAGPVLTAADIDYQKAVETKRDALGLGAAVQLLGPMSHADLAKLYTNAALHLSLSETGSMDKTVMEALACGCAVLTTNIAFRETISAYPEMFSLESNPRKLAEKILQLYQYSYDANELRELVVGHHDFASWMDKVTAQLQELRPGQNAPAGGQ